MLVDFEYQITILCPWREVKKGGFPTALAAYEYVARMEEISRDDVNHVKIERVKRNQED